MYTHAHHGHAADAGLGPLFDETQRRAWNGTKAFRLRMLEWRRRIRSRNELMLLNERDMRDIGATPTDVARETRKPFWRP